MTCAVVVAAAAAIDVIAAIVVVNILGGYGLILPSFPLMW